MPAKKNSTTHSNRLLHLLILLFVFASVLIVYKDLPSAKFFLDDYLHLHLIQKLDNPFEPFVVDIFMGAFFRPAITLFWKLDFLLSGLDATGYYLMNLVYLCISVLFLYFLMMHLTGSRFLSGITSFLFAISPVTGVGVMWLSNRFDLIGSMLFLMSTFLFVRYVRYQRINNYILSIILATVSFFCKEITITLPVVLLFSAGFMFLYRAPEKFDGRLVKRLLALSTPYFTLAAFYIIWRFLIIKSLGGYVGEVKAQFTVGYIFFLWHSFSEYFWLVRHFSVFGLIVFITAMLLAKKDFYNNNKVFFYGLLFAVVTSVPLLLVFRYQNVIGYMMPRFFFLPNIGLIIALASVFDPKSGRSRRILAVVFLLILGLFMALNNYILVHKWVKDKQKLVAEMEEIHEFISTGIPGDPAHGLIYSCLHGMDVALDTSIKMMHPEYIDKYYFLNCTGPTQVISDGTLYQEMRRFLTFPKSFSRNPCDYKDLTYGVVETNPIDIPPQVGGAQNVMVLHLDRQGKMAILHREKVVFILRTLGILE